jgi:nucleoside-triphosphatase
VANWLLTGPPGVGKTTVVAQVVERLGVRAGGFYTREIREHGRRLGFAINTLDGQEGILAHVDAAGRPRVSRYGVNVADIDGVAVPALLRALRGAALIVVDEIGRMELFSDRFRQAVMACLDSPKPLLGTIQAPGPAAALAGGPARREPFLDAIRNRPDVSLYVVSRDNREELVGLLIEALRRAAS